MEITGKTWRFGDNIDTDVIIPARYLNTTDPKELAQHCMEDADPSFARKVGQGDIIVAGPNFGCGSSREHAPRAIKAAGVGCVVAKSFARIFYRNAINIGLPIVACEAADEIPEGVRITVNLTEGRIELPDGRVLRTLAFPAFMQEIIENGGLMGYVRSRLREAG